MRFWLCVCVALSLAVLPSVASAADQVPEATLAQAGLSGMQQMTDAQGMDVRGTGFAVVSGVSWIAMPAGGEHSYKAVSSPRFGSALAKGGSVSKVEFSSVSENFRGVNCSSSTICASGGAFAYAK